MPAIQRSPVAPRQPSSVHRSLYAQFAESAANQPPQEEAVIPEVNVTPEGMDADDATSNAPSNISSSVSLFAGGTREIDIFLRSTRNAIDANMAQWYEKRKVFGAMTQEQLEKTKDEKAIQAAEDLDHLRCCVGNDITTWAMHACKMLSLKDYGDRAICHRIAKYVDRQRAKFEEFGFVMAKDANLEMKQRCILPTAEFILRQGGEPEKRPRDDESIISPPHKKKVVDEIDNSDEVEANPQDALALGSEAADVQHLSHVQPPLPGLGRRSTSPHAISAYQQIAQQLEEERKQQEEIVRKQSPDGGDAEEV